MSKEAKENPMHAFLRDMERRIKALENDVAFMREHGISEEEQKIVLGRPSAGNGGRLLLIAYLVLNTLLLGWCLHNMRETGNRGAAGGSSRPEAQPQSVSGNAWSPAPNTLSGNSESRNSPFLLP